jgi:hypothetical protein
MFNYKKHLVVGALLFSSLAFAGDGSGGPGTYGGESITHATSPHNISATTTIAGDNGEVCVYCHTPHAADTSFAGAPIWNKAAMTSTFTMYGTTVGGTATDASPASPSLACLSCHDGISAVDSILNAPGSGMGSLAAGSDNIVGILTTPYGGNIGGVPGVVLAGTVGNLANDHPVSITYDPTKASLRATADTIPVGTSGDAWVTPGGGTTIAALLRNGKVECSSCHDPHNATGVAQATATQVNYLRHTNVNSELCFGCHNK